MTAPFLLAAAAAAAAPPPPAARVDTQPARRRPAPRAIPAAVALVVAAALVVDRASLVFAASMAAAAAVHAVAARREAAVAARRSQAAAAFLGHLATNLEAGAAPPVALARAADHLPADAPPELARDVARLKHHARTGAGVGAFTADTPELARLGVLWALSATRGVPLARLAAAARDEIDLANRHRAATRAALAGPQTTAVVLALLPLAGVLMGTAMGANPVAFLAGGGLRGVLLTVGTALVCAGVVVSQRIIQGAAS